MDDGRLRAVRDHDEVAVPGAEVVQRGEHLGLLGAELGTSHALLGLAGRKLDAVDGLLLALAGLCPERIGGIEDHAGRGGRVEGGVPIRAARRVEKRVAACPCRLVEEPRRPVEPAAGHATQHADLRRREPGALAEIHSATAARDSLRNGTSWQRERIVSGSGPSSSATSTSVAYAGGSSRSLRRLAVASSFIRWASKMR